MQRGNTSIHFKIFDLWYNLRVNILEWLLVFLLCFNAKYIYLFLFVAAPACGLPGSSHTTQKFKNNIFLYFSIFKKSPGLRPFGVCDHLLFVRLLILRRECRGAPGDRSVPRVPVGGLFSSLWRSTARFSAFFGRPGTSSKNWVFSTSSKINKNGE